MNKKAVLPAIAIMGIIFGALIVLNIIGVSVLFSKLSDSPLLFVFIIIGFIILLKKMGGKN